MVIGCCLQGRQWSVPCQLCSVDTPSLENPARQCLWFGLILLMVEYLGLVGRLSLCAVRVHAVPIAGQADLSKSAPCASQEP